MHNGFRYKRRVEFRDTDMARIVHFSVFFTYMEEAEHDFLRSLGLGVFSEHQGDTISWPRVAAECNYRSAIRFEDEIEVRVAIQRIGKSSVTWQHKIFKGEIAVADGTVTAVCCKISHDGKPEPVDIPQSIVDKLSPFVVDTPHS